MVSFPVQQKTHACSQQRNPINARVEKAHLSPHEKIKPNTAASPNPNSNEGARGYQVAFHLPIIRERCHIPQGCDLRIKKYEQILIRRLILTKETQAARSRILTRRSSNCSTTSSHRDLPKICQSTAVQITLNLALALFEDIAGETPNL